MLSLPVGSNEVGKGGSSTYGTIVVTGTQAPDKQRKRRSPPALNPLPLAAKAGAIRTGHGEHGMRLRILRSCLGHLAACLQVPEC